MRLVVRHVAAIKIVIIAQGSTHRLDPETGLQCQSLLETGRQDGQFLAGVGGFCLELLALGSGPVRLSLAIKSSRCGTSDLETVSPQRGWNLDRGKEGLEAVEIGRGDRIILVIVTFRAANSEAQENAANGGGHFTQ